VVFFDPFSFWIFLFFAAGDFKGCRSERAPFELYDLREEEGRRSKWLDWDGTWEVSDNENELWFMLLADAFGNWNCLRVLESPALDKIEPGPWSVWEEDIASEPEGYEGKYLLFEDGESSPVDSHCLRACLWYTRFPEIPFGTDLYKW
jgi:hypothetical protein